MEAVGAAASIVALVEISAKLGRQCVDYIKKVRGSKDEIRRLATENDALAQILKQIQDLLSDDIKSASVRHQLDSSQKLHKNLTSCGKMLQDLTAKLDQEPNASRWKRYVGALKWPLSSTEVSEAISALHRWREMFQTALSIDQVNIARRIEDALDVANLPFAKGAAFDDYDNELEPRCHPETRMDLLRQVASWADTPEGKCVFWLCGPAGAGKSTISQTVAHTFAERNQLGASFFFNKTRDGRNTANLFVTTIARQLARRVPKLKDLILAAIQKDPDLPGKALRTQFSSLVLEPLKTFEPEGLLVPTLVLVVDALDECEAENLTGADTRCERSRMIINLLASMASVKGFNMRVFLTSRPEVPIRLGFRDEIPRDSHQSLALHNIPESIIKHDIGVFLESHLEQIRSSYQIPQEWPGEDAVMRLVELSTPLFIYAATICKFINDPSRRFSPRAQLEEFMERSQGATDIETTYKPVLEQILRGLNDARQESELVQFRRIVGSIILLADPLPLRYLSQLLQTDSDKVVCHLNNLHSVLNVPEDNDSDSPISLFHLSFREYLLANPGGKNRFWIEEQSKHGELLDCCLEVMSNKPGKEFCLKNDICQLNEPGVYREDVPSDHIKRHIPRHLEYSCIYWVHHLHRSHKTDRTKDKVYDFLSQHFVHWVEAMSWLGKIEQVVEEVMALQDLYSLNTDAASFLRDAWRFLVEHKYIIDLTPCQVYSSALLYSPQNSVIRKTFWPEIPEWILKAPGAALDWNATSRPIKRYRQDIGSVAFSPDGGIVAAATGKEIDVLRTVSGTVLETLSEFDSSPLCVVFVSNTRLAVGLQSGTIIFWDFEQDRKTPVHLSDSPITYLAVSVTGRTVSAFEEGRVCLLDEDHHVVHDWHASWYSRPSDYQSPLQVEDTVTFPNDLSVAYSPDGTFLAFTTLGQSDNIEIYDAGSGLRVREIPAPDGFVFGELAISPKNLLLAAVGVVEKSTYSLKLDTVSKDAYAWDLDRSSDSPTYHLDVTLGISQRPSFNKNEMLAIVDDTFKLSLWDGLRDSPQLIAEIDNVCDPCWSPDGKQILAINRFEGEVKVIDIDHLENASQQDKSEHSVDAPLDPRFLQLVSSPDGTRVAMISGRGSLKVWNINTANGGDLTACLCVDPRPSLSKVYDCVTAEWSPDSRFVAVALPEELIIYQSLPSSSHFEQTHSRGYDQPAHRSQSCLSFSPCGGHLAMGEDLEKPRVTVWDFPSLQVRWVRNVEAEGSEYSFNVQLRIAPGGKHLVLLLWSTLQLMDLDSGAVMWTKKFDNTLQSMALNSVGSMIAVFAFDLLRHDDDDDSDNVDAGGYQVDLFAAEGGRLLEKMVLTKSRPNFPLLYSFMSFAGRDKFVVVNEHLFDVNNANVSSQDGGCDAIIKRACQVSRGYRRGHTGIWIVKDGRGLLHVPSHCDIGVEKNWIFHPHRQVSFDKRTNKPFVIELACDNCIFEDGWDKS
ncbi:Putative fungal domain of STAND protein [Colletotrichum destructivum]|uniref:Fungal domain of STAND protein n=1 Tax=Colletotrichum destructivum TaxID=34406 RepID=A0AAX4IIN8_9PEZI|nr:Putative fungal domain of STAND protein [Colletotrichum destructivum]